MPAKTVVKADALADFKVASPRQSGYVVAPSATRADVPAISESAYVTRGVNVRGKGQNTVEIPCLILRDGSMTRALELSVIASALSGGVITSAEVDALLGR